MNKILKDIKVFTFAALLLLGFCLTSGATNYYTGASGSPTTLTNWWTGTNASGSHPANFTTTGDVFTIQSTHTLTTTANSSWTVKGTVITDTGGKLAVTSTGTTLNLGALTINSGGTATINRPLTVTGATSISGTIGFGSTSSKTRAMTFSGDVTLNSSAVWNEPASSNGSINTYSFGGNFTNNATSFNALGTGVHTFSGTAKTFSGATNTSISSVTITGTRTNSGTFTVRTTLAGTGALTNGNGTNGTLNLGGTISLTTLTATAANNQVNYTGVAQTARVTTYVNITLSGSGAKTFATTPTVNGILSMEGTATAVVTSGVVTYGTGATLQYNTATARTASTEEWITPFVGSGGIIIKNTGAITTPGAVQIGSNTSVPLNIYSGATLTPGANSLTFHGDFINAGTITSGSFGLTIAGTVATQSIAGYTTTGTTALTKTAGTATFQGNVSGGPLTITGTGGTLNLGTALTHTFTGDVTLTAGTLNGGSSTISANSVSTTAWNGTGSVFSAGTGTVNFGAAGNQTLSATATTFNNLTLSNSGIKTFSNTPTVNKVLSMEGTATIFAAPTYGSTATLHYNTATSRSAGVEWITPFVASGGVVIANTGTITMPGARVFNSTAPLTVNSGSAMSMSTFLLTLNGNFVNNGGTAAGTTGGVTITGTTTQSIGAFTTTGTVLMSKTGGVSTLTGNVNGAGLTINGSGGTLNLGAVLTHTFTGDITLTAGSLNGGSSILNENNISTTAWNGTGSLFTPASSTINFGAAGAQTLAASGLSFFNLALSGSGTKTFSSALAMGNNMAFSGTAVANLGSVDHNSKSLSFNGTNQASGTWGGTASQAANINNTWFLSTATGALNVNCTAPAAPTSGGNQTICAGETIPALTVTVASGTADWYSQASGGTQLASNSLTYTPSGAGTFYAETDNGGCLSPNRAAVTLTVNPGPTLLSLTGSSICTSPGGNGTITSTTSVSGVNYQLYNSGNVAQGAAKPGNGSGLSWTALPVGTGYYVKGTNTVTTCTSVSSTVDISAYPNPDPIALTGSTICTSPGTDGVISSATSETGVNYQLYDDSNSPVQAAQSGTGTGLAWVNLTAGTGYYVKGTSAATSCVSSNSNAVDISTTPNPDALVLSGSTICETPGTDGTITSSTSQLDVDYQLYDINDLEVGTPVPGTGSGLTWTNLTAASGYYAVGTNSITLCDAANSNTVSVIITPNPTITSSSTAAAVCLSTSLQYTTLSYSATTSSPTNYTITWNSAAHTAGLVDVTTTTLPVSPITFPVAANVAGGTYTGTLTVTNAGGCVSPGNSFTVKVNTAPVAPTGSATQIFCSGATVSNLSATGSNISWYSTQSGGTALSSSMALVNGTHYYASQTGSGCESSSRLDVTAIVASTGSWIGTTSTNWFTTTNWCGGALPTSSTNVTVAAGLTNYPSIGTTGAVCNNITIESGASLTITGSNTLTVSGSWTKTGTFIANSSTVVFNGSGTGSIGASNFSNITFSGAGAKTATGALTIAGNVSITNNFTAGAFTHTVAGNWTNSGTFTATGSTVDFNGSGAGTIGAGNFNNVIFSGAGTKTAAGILAIAGNVSITNNFTAGAYTHTVSGNWTKSGTFTATGSTINFNGSGAGNIGAGNFNHITFSGAGTKTATGILNIVGNVTISNNFSAGSFAHSVQGNWSNNGSFTPNTGTITLIGASAQAIAGSNSTTFHNLTQNGNGVINLGIETTITGTLTLTLGLLDIAAYNLTITSSGSVSGGSSTSYVKTSGTGRLKQSVPGVGGSKVYPVGNSAFNPMTVQYNDINASKNFGIRVEDGPITNANSATTVNRKWYLASDAVGTSNLTLTTTYNSGEEGTGFSNSSSPQIGYFDGTSWAYRAIDSGSGSTTFTASGSAPDFTNPSGFFVLGSGDAFIASKFAVTNLSPVNPSLGLANTSITVQSQNSQGVPTMVGTATGFMLSCTNTTMSTAPTGAIYQYAFQTTVSSVMFTSSTYNTGTSSYNHNATVSATSTSGESLTAGTSAVFDVYNGAIYEPVASENWDATNGWKKSTDGGSTWTNPATLPAGNIFATNDLIRVPAGITLTANVTASFYSCLVYGTLDIASSGNLTLNHSLLNDYNLLVLGTLKNSGGTLINNNTEYPTELIEIQGGTYWHNRDGGSIPACTWYSLGVTPSTCNITGVTSSALTSGLNQTFENFTWNNSSQTVTQNLSADMTVNGTLTLTAGKITTGSNHVIVGLNGTASNSGAGYINGILRRYVSSTTTTGDFPVGDANYYAPFSIAVNSGTPSGNGYLDVSTTAAQPPLASGLSQTKYINRKWTIANNGVAGITTYSPGCTFVDADKVGSPTTGSLKLRKFTISTWYTTNGAATGNTITAAGLSTAGLTATSDFYVGEDDCTSTNAVWLGSTSTDWNTAGNWCSGLAPTAATDVTIPSSPVNQPVIGSSGGSCKNLTIAGGATLTISGSYTLDVKGNWSDSGTFTAGAGSVSFTGSSAQTISGTTVFNNLTINNTAGVTAANNITVNGVITLTSANPDATHGTLDMGSYTLSTLNASAGITGTGDITGVIKGRHTFTHNTSYQFGSQYTTLNFLNTGTQPDEVSCRISIGAAPSWKPGAVLRYYSFAQTGTAGTDQVTLNLSYLTTELNSNDETKLVLWDHHFIGGNTHEHGKSNNSATNHWVGLSGRTISYVALTTIDNKEWCLTNYSSTKNTWSGVINTDWNNGGNWTAGHAPLTTEDVMIPDVSSGSNITPLLTSDVEIKTLEIASGATVTAGSWGLTINGYNQAWQNNGTFDPGTGIVTFTHGNLSEIVAVSGVTQFHNLIITANTFVKPGTGALIKISGMVNGDASSIVDLSSLNNTVEYNGADQYIVNPSTTGFAERGYYNLIISGTGAYLVDDLDISGDFTSNGALNAGTGTVSFIGITPQTISGTTAPLFSNLTINNSAGVTASSNLTVNGTLYLESDNPASLDRGTLAMETGKILNLGVDATTTGTGDVSGIIKRTNAFVTNTFYTFGNVNQGLTFPVVSGQTLPTSITVRVSIGRDPNWGSALIGGKTPPSDVTKRLYEFEHTGGSATKTIFRINYKDNELADGVNESTLSIWSYYIPGTAIADEGWSNYDANANYITLSEINLSNIPEGTLGDFQVAIAPTSSSFKTWNGSNSTDWNNPSNWTPNGVPTTSFGVIIPDANTTPFQPTLPVYGAAQATCQYLIIENNGVLNSGASDNATITIIDGVVGDAWGCETGGTFNPGNSTVIFAIGGTDAASISGSTNFYNVTITGGAGSRLRPGNGCYMGISGLLDITAGYLGAATNENTIEFKGNSTQVIPNPNGSTPGYHNLILSGSGTKTLPATLNIVDEFINNTTATNKVDAATNSSTVIFNGIVYSQVIGGTTVTAFNNLSLNNLYGLTLETNANVAGTVTFSSGVITTGVNQLIVDKAAIVSGAGAGKYVNGNLQKGIGASTTSKTFEIGNSTDYLPLTIDFSGTATNGAGYITCSTTDGKHPDYNSAGLSQAKYLNRYWTVTNGGVTFETYDATFTFVPGDLTGSATVSNLIISKYDGAWHAATTLNPTSTTVKTTGNTSFSDFIAGEALSYATDYFRSATTGNWNSPSTWESSSDSITWNQASLAPDNSAHSITISSGNTVTVSAAATASNLYISGTLTSGSAIELSINGIWENAGTFNAATGTITFNGTTTISGTTTNSFNNLTISGTLTGPSDGTINVAGIWSNSGEFTHNSGTVNFNGASPQTISGLNSFNNLTINNSAGVSALANQTVNGELKLSSLNPSSTKGALYMGHSPDSEYVLYMGANATTTGIGDVSGYINRSYFELGKDYTFGNPFTLMNFTVGPLPGSVTLEVYLTSSNPVWKPDAIHRYFDITRTGGTSATRLKFRVHYLDSELNGANENDLVLFDYHVDASLAHEHGRSDYNTSDNWVGFANVGLVFLGTASADDHFWTLGPNLTNNTCTWIGGSPSGPTDWDLPGNWEGGVPGTDSHTIIPGGVTYWPVLPAGALPDGTLPNGRIVNTLEILFGGVLNCTTGTPTLTLTGSDNAWQNYGTLNAGSGTVVFTNAAATMAGETNFNNVTVDNGSVLTPETYNQMNISGVLSLSSTGILNAATNVNTINYNKNGDQTVIVPNGSPSGYSSLTLSGSGVKTMPGSALNIHVDFTLSGSVTTTPLTTVTVSGTTTINGTSNLILGGADRLSDSGAITMNGGMFSTAGYTETVGTIDLTGNSTIALGSGAHTLTFAASNAISWTAGKVVTVTGWTGNWDGTSGTAGKIVAGNSNTGLTSGQLAQIRFLNGLVYYSSTILDNGEVVPNGVASNYTWIGGSDTDWTNADNWSSDNGGAPPSDAVVVISTGTFQPRVTGVINCFNLTLNSGTILTITATGVLNVSNVLTNSAGITGLVLESGSDIAGNTGVLINNTPGVAATVQRWMTGDLWHLISPAATGGETIASFVGASQNGNLVARNSANYGLASYLVNNDNWDYYKVSGSNTSGYFSDPGKGYQILRSTGAGTGRGRVKTTDDGIVSFKGTLAAADQSIALDKMGNRWNLLGNPYPCALKIADFLEANADLIDPSYLFIYVSAIADTTTYSYIPNTTDLKLSSGEAFFVKARDGSTLPVNFTTAMKSATSDNFKAALIDYPAVTLTAETGEDKMSTLVKYMEGMTKGLDPGWDAGMFNGAPSSFTLFTRLLTDNGVDFAIQCLPENNYDKLIIPVGLVASKGSKVTFKASATNLPPGYKVYLEDQRNNTFHLLDDAGGEYAVILGADIRGTGRFYLHTSQIAPTEPTDLSRHFKIIPFPDQQSIRILGEADLPARASVYDMSGRLITARMLTGLTENEIPLVNANNGVYVIKIESATTPQTQKFLWIKK